MTSPACEPARLKAGPLFRVQRAIDYIECGERVTSGSTMNRREAEAHIVREFEAWVKRTGAPGTLPSGTEALVFYAYLESERPHLLKFSYPGDRWQVVHGWLRRRGLVRD